MPPGNEKEPIQPIHPMQRLRSRHQLCENPIVYECDTIRNIQNSTPDASSLRASWTACPPKRRRRRVDRLTLPSAVSPSRQLRLVLTKQTESDRIRPNQTESDQTKVESKKRMTDLANTTSHHGTGLSAAGKRREPGAYPGSVTSNQRRRRAKGPARMRRCSCAVPQPIITNHHQIQPLAHRRWTVGRRPPTASRGPQTPDCGLWTVDSTLGNRPDS
jgi:hypothetical protein